MKVILSRKGFDLDNGNQASPILPDGTLLTLPIPSKFDDVKYSEIYYNDKSYLQIIRELKPDSFIEDKFTCHLDPELRYDVRKRTQNFRGIFGQYQGRQQHLKNQNVGIGDLFLFFGWFKQTKFVNDALNYVEDSLDKHIIFGYLQIGEIHTSIDTINERPDLEFVKNHPHATIFKKIPKNAIYVATENLIFKGKQTNIPGFGCFKYDKRLELTKEGETRTRWDQKKLPNNLKPIDSNESPKITYHYKKAWMPNGIFQSVAKGQEFVIEDDPNVEMWAVNLIRNSEKLVTNK